MRMCCLITSQATIPKMHWQRQENLMQEKHHAEVLRQSDENAWLGNFHKDQEESIVHMCRTTWCPIDTASSTRISQDAHPPYYLRQSTPTSMILTSHQITDQEQPHRDLTDTMKLYSCHCRTWLVGCHTMSIYCLLWVYCSKIDINRFNWHNGGSTVTVSCSLFVSYKRRSDKWQKLYWVLFFQLNY